MDGRSSDWVACPACQKREREGGGREGGREGEPNSIGNIDPGELGWIADRSVHWIRISQHRLPHTTHRLVGHSLAFEDSNARSNGTRMWWGRSRYIDCQ